MKLTEEQLYQSMGVEETPGEKAKKPPKGGRPQSEEERRENAAQRRRAEQKAAVDEAVRKAVEAERARLWEELDRRRQDEMSRQSQAGFYARLEDELREIQRLDPSVHSLEDIVRGPGGQRFYGYVKGGLSYLDAFYLANRERLAQQMALAGKRQAQELERSKAHLTAAGGVQGPWSDGVPGDQLDLFRELNPGVSQAEIQSYYNKYNQR